MVYNFDGSQKNVKGKVMLNENDSLQTICEFIKKEHSCKAIILYGSRAKKTASPKSDYDLAIVRDSNSKELLYRQLINPFNLELDCVFIPLKRVHAFLEQKHAKYDEPFRYFYKGKNIDQTTSIGKQLIDKIEYFIKSGPKPISEGDKQERVRWLNKMLNRSYIHTPVYQFRKYEFFTHLLYNYFYLRDRWYLGAKESFLQLEEQDPKTYDAFLQIMNGNFKDEDLINLLTKIQNYQSNI